MTNQVQITAYPRIHLTLIGMNDKGYRINGGIGFAINNPNVEIVITKSKLFVFNDIRKLPFKHQEIIRIQDVINNACQEYKFNHNINVSIKSSMPTHFGFGSSTMIRLACLEGLFQLNEFKVSKNTIVKLSGRGRTSGIGIRTYFNGGYILDVGQKSKGLSLLPSSNREKVLFESLSLISEKMPNWNLGICIPKTISRISEEDERIFFNKTCPVKDHSVYETLYHSLYGIVASFKENDINVFNNACNKIQKCEWKKKERELYGKELLKYEIALKNFGAKAVGMTSLGPSLFFTGDNIADIQKKMTDKFDSEIEIIQTQPINKGRCLSNE